MFCLEEAALLTVSRGGSVESVFEAGEEEFAALFSDAGRGCVSPSLTGVIGAVGFVLLAGGALLDTQPPIRRFGDKKMI